MPLIRPLVLVCAAALLAGACASDDPSLSVAPVEALRDVGTVWVDDEDEGALPPPRPPELYDASGAQLGDASGPEVGDAEQLPPPELGFTDLAEALGGLDLGTEPPDAGDRESVASADEVRPTAAAEDGAGGSDRPAPPSAASGPPPAYPDPSEMIAVATGRAIHLFDDDGGVGASSGVSSTTITVAGIVAESIAGSPYRPDVCLGARARFAQANHHDELTREVRLGACHDDSGRTDISEGLYRSMARDDVFAVVPVGSPAFTTGSGAEPALPYVGRDPLPSFCGRRHSMGFGVHGAQGCPVLEARGFVSLSHPVLTALARSAKPRIDAADTVVYAVETGPGGEAIASSRRFEAELLGLAEPTFMAVLPAPSESPPLDWSPVASALDGPDPDIVVVEGPVREGLVDALRALGFAGEIVAVGATDPWDQVGAGVDAVVSLGFDIVSRDTPGWRALVGGARFVGVAEADIGMDFVEGYLAADFFVQAAAATPEPLTQRRLADAVNGGWWYPGVDGVTCGSWWPASHMITAPCVSLADSTDDAGLVPAIPLVSTEPQLRFAIGEG